MTRKLIAAFLIFAMLIPYSSAVAADKEAVTPTVEEILNEYHQKSFEAQQARETGTASANSRSGAGSGKTLEQETVETLTAAGYEAYNVTADNYETLETQLQTDFDRMGLDPNSSYIVVVHGEEPNTPANNARGPSDIVQDPGDLSGGSPHISYVYKGKTYYLRYVTVTAAAAPNQMIVNSVYADIEQDLANHYARNIFNTMLVGFADALCEEIPICGGIPIGTIASLVFDRPEDYMYAELSLGALSIHAQTRWNYNYLEVWNALEQKWEPAQYSEYTISMAYCAGIIYDPVTDHSFPAIYNPQYFTIYSAGYHNTEERLLSAMKAYDRYTISPDTVHSVSFFWGDETGEVIMGDSMGALFQHGHPVGLVLPEED